MSITDPLGLGMATPRTALVKEYTGSAPPERSIPGDVWHNPNDGNMYRRSMSAATWIFEGRSPLTLDKPSAGDTMRVMPPAERASVPPVTTDGMIWHDTYTNTVREFRNGDWVTVPPSDMPPVILERRSVQDHRNGWYDLEKEYMDTRKEQDAEVSIKAQAFRDSYPQRKAMADREQCVSRAMSFHPHDTDMHERIMPWRQPL